MIWRKVNISTSDKKVLEKNFFHNFFRKKSNFSTNKKKFGRKNILEKKNFEKKNSKNIFRKKVFKKKIVFDQKNLFFNMVFLECLLDRSVNFLEPERGTKRYK